MTLAFLQSGDQLRTDRLCSEGVCVEALTPLCFRSDAETSDEAGGYDAVNRYGIWLVVGAILGAFSRFYLTEYL